MNVNEIQLQKCNQYGALPVSYSNDSKLGIALNVRDEIVPLNGLRMNPSHGTCGWYIWAGDWSDDADFFHPLHVKHLNEWCPAALPFLQLPPGWRFLLAPGHEDVWHDSGLDLRP
jgi:hypothetical protein